MLAYCAVNGVIGSLFGGGIGLLNFMFKHLLPSFCKEISIGISIVINAFVVGYTWIQVYKKEINIRNAIKTTVQGIGGSGASYFGAIGGAAIGSIIIPGVGTFIGGVVGAILANFLAQIGIEVAYYFYYKKERTAFSFFDLNFENYTKQEVKQKVENFLLVFQATNQFDLYTKHRKTVFDFLEYERVTVLDIEGLKSILQGIVTDEEEMNKIFEILKKEKLVTKTALKECSKKDLKELKIDLGVALQLIKWSKI